MKKIRSSKLLYTTLIALSLLGISQPKTYASKRALYKVKSLTEDEELVKKIQENLKACLEAYNSPKKISLKKLLTTFFEKTISEIYENNTVFFTDKINDFASQKINKKTDNKKDHQRVNSSKITEFIQRTLKAALQPDFMQKKEPKKQKSEQEKKQEDKRRRNEEFLNSQESFFYNNNNNNNEASPEDTNN